MPKEFIAVDIRQFRNATRDIGFDVYLKLAADNFAHVFSKTTGLDCRRLVHYIHKGIQELYILKEDDFAYKQFISQTADLVFHDAETPQEKKIAVLLNMTEQNIAEVFVQFELEQETVDNTRKVIKNYVHLMTENPSSLAIILKLVAHGEYLYYHSIAVSIFTMILAKALGQFDAKTVEVIAMGGFLHDIGLSKVPKEIVDNLERLKPEEFEIMKAHPQEGLRMISNVPNIPNEAKYIVYQHHEQPSGRGYPNALKGSAIFYPAKIASVADGFSILLSRNPYRQPYSPEKAIQILQGEMGKYNLDLVNLLASIFLRKESDREAA